LKVFQSRVWKLFCQFSYDAAAKSSKNF
jgi:hypothetical protein